MLNRSPKPNSSEVLKSRMWKTKHKKGLKGEKEANTTSRNRNRVDMHEMMNLPMGHSKWDSKIF